jgi:hypothetical protein
VCRIEELVGYPLALLSTSATARTPEASIESTAYSRNQDAMTDFYPLIDKAVARLEQNTVEARRVLYERAHTSLVGQLRNKNPLVTDSEIFREGLALEEAIRRVEAETEHRLSMKPPRHGTLSTVRPGGPRPEQDPPRREQPAPPPTALVRTEYRAGHQGDRRAPRALGHSVRGRAAPAAQVRQWLRSTASD